MAKHSWQGAVDYTDILLFSASAFQHRREKSVPKRVAVFATAELALWDPTIVERLARESIEDILNPMAVLCQIANDRGWLASDAACGKRKCRGGWLSFFEGREQVHSAMLACSGRADEIQRRIWRAEVGVMLPFVEEKRHEVLRLLDGFLQVPFRTRFGDVIDDVRDLEIGHIEVQLRSGGMQNDFELLRLVKRLGQVRNHLSYVETLPPDLIAGWP